MKRVLLAMIAGGLWTAAGITLSEGRLWFLETGVSPNRLVGFGPQTETFTQ